MYRFLNSQTSNAGPKLESCVLAANVYIVLVQIPGEKSTYYYFANDYQI